MRKMKSEKISLIVLTVIIAFFFLAVMPVSAEVTELWNRTYDGGFDDCARGVATDTEDNVIVTGYSLYKKIQLYTYLRYHTIKYDKDGNELWCRTHGSGPNFIGHDVATDAEDNVIVTGRFGDDYNTIKYDKDGNELWNRSYDGGREDKAFGVATDTSGNVIVTGQSYIWRYTSNCDWDYHTIKYDADGTVLWQRRYNSGGNDYGRGVATDTEDNVIVTGTSRIIKYDRDGNVLWSRPNSWGSGYCVATDAEDNVVVTGSSRIIKYDRDGILLWDITGGGVGITTDTEGNVIIAGWSKTIMYDADGTELWRRIYGGGYYKDGATGVATDAEDNVIVTGYVWDGSTNNYYTIKYGETTKTPTVTSSNATGIETNTFGLNENVYCYAENLTPNDPAVDIYVVQDKAWSVNDSIGSDVSGGIETVSTDDNGNIDVTMIWPAQLTEGMYDIIIDLNQNGTLDAGEPVDDVTLGEGFEAVPEFSTIAIPVVAILGLFFLFSRRKRKEWNSCKRRQQ
jgi:hypothetical protein